LKELYANLLQLSIGMLSGRKSFETFSCAVRKTWVDFCRREVALKSQGFPPAVIAVSIRSPERGIATSRLGAFHFQWEGYEHIKPSSLRNGVKFG